MHILITGATGFIGTALTSALEAKGDSVRALRRGTTSGGPGWDIEADRVDDDALDGVDAVIHLAGEPILPPWTASKKQRILRSRTRGTALIARAVAGAGTPVLVSASGMDYYGDRGDEVLDESASKGEGFMSDVAHAWEEAADPARDAGVRVVHLRTSLVLHESGGSLRTMMIPFRLLIGGPVGSGEQFWSFISLEDQVRAIIHCLDTDGIRGPVNMASPHPVRNAEFAAELGRAMGRPSFVRTPGFLLKPVLGAEAAEALLLQSKRLAPTVLSDSGFTFSHPTLTDALAAAIS